MDLDWSLTINETQAGQRLGGAGAVPIMENYIDECFNNFFWNIHVLQPLLNEDMCSSDNVPTRF